MTFANVLKMDLPQVTSSLRLTALGHWLQVENILQMYPGEYYGIKYTSERQVEYEIWLWALDTDRPDFVCCYLCLITILDQLQASLSFVTFEKYRI